MSESLNLTNATLKTVLTDAMVVRAHVTDLNEAPAGISQVNGSSVLNLPPGAYKYGIVETAITSNFATQKDIPHTIQSNGYGFYTRISYNNNWQPWVGYVGVKLSS